MVDWTSHAGKLRSTFVAFFEAFLDDVSDPKDIPRVNLDDLKRYARENKFQERTAISAWTLLLRRIDPTIGRRLDVIYTGVRDHPHHAHVSVESLKGISTSLEVLRVSGMGPRMRQLLLDWVTAL